MIGLILTGTRGAGKTTTADLLSRMSRVRQVPSVTTREPRPDDVEGTYAYVPKAELRRALQAGQLLVDAEYAGNLYGVRQEEVDALVSDGFTPVLIVTPEAATRITQRDSATSWVHVFLDASDEVLDARLSAQGRPATETDARQRAVDRLFVPARGFLIDTDADDEAVARMVLTALDGVERP